MRVRASHFLFLVWMIVAGHAADLTPLGTIRLLRNGETFAPSDRNSLFTAEGVVTTPGNLTDSPNFLFYMQDETGGIAVFWRNFVQPVPAPGDRVRVTARVDHSSGLLRLVPDANDLETEVTILSSENALPEPFDLRLAWRTDPTLMELFEGTLVVLTNMVFDLNEPRFPSSGGTVMMQQRNTLESFPMRILRRVADVTGELKPKSAATIYGVLSQSDGSSPYTGDYQILPRSLADIVPTGPAAPEITFTNTLALIRMGDAETNQFSEIVLLPGESLHISAVATQTAGLPVALTGIPASAWTVGGAAAGLFFEARESDAGKSMEFSVLADSEGSITTASWTFYVPAIEERSLVIMEFLANPSANSDSPLFNPLSRLEPAPATSQDEFVELVNVATNAVNLSGWTIGDTIGLRHTFPDGTSIRAGGAVVVYGGPLEGFLPQTPVASFAASVGGESGLALNNSGGDLVAIRNAAGNLVHRVSYRTAPSTGSLTRTNFSSGFISHANVSTRSVSPGTWPDGSAYELSTEEPEVVEPPNLALVVNEAGGFEIRWAATPDKRYSLLFTADLDIPFAPSISGASFSDGAGFFEVHPEGAAGFYRVVVDP